MKKFEYYSQYMRPAEDQEYKSQLDAMGSLGWELVDITPDDLHVFKRECVEQTNKKELLLEENGTTQ